MTFLTLFIFKTRVSVVDVFCYETVLYRFISFAYFYLFFANRVCMLCGVRAGSAIGSALPSCCNIVVQGNYLISCDVIMKCVSVVGRIWYEFFMLCLRAGAGPKVAGEDGARREHGLCHWTVTLSCTIKPYICCVSLHVSYFM